MQDAEHMVKVVSIKVGAAVENADMLKPSYALIDVGSFHPGKNALHVPRCASAQKQESQYVELMGSPTQIHALRSVMGWRRNAQESAHVRNHVCAQRNTNQFVVLMVNLTQTHAVPSVKGWSRSVLGSVHARSRAHVLSCINQFVVLMVRHTIIRALRSVLG